MRVAALYIYPVKSCRAVALEQATLGTLGLEHDRRFAFIDADGRALTQRDLPLLATVQPEFNGNELRLDFGGLFASVFTDFTEPVAVSVWSRHAPARATRREIAFDYFGMHVRLAALDQPAVDAQPVLVTTTGMLARLNLPGIGMERFRPNVVLEGHGEWRELRGEKAVLQYAEPCGRCEVTTIDQTSGERRGPEPLQTLQDSFAGNFGVYCRVARAGRLRRGEILGAL